MEGRPSFFMTFMYLLTSIFSQIIRISNVLQRGFYMSDRVLLNTSTEGTKKDQMRGFADFYPFISQRG